MSKDKTFWMERQEYLDYLWEACLGQLDGGVGVILRQIAVNIHEIAKQLAKMNGKKPPEDESNY